MATASEIPLAHSAGPRGEPQPLIDHLRAVAERASAFGAKFGAGDLTYWTGLWHDIGKFNPAFQRYIRHPAEGHGPDHSSAGAVLASRILEPLAFPIAGHHAGLASRDALKVRVRDKVEDAAVITALDLATHTLPELVPSQSLVSSIPIFASDAEKASVEFLIRMLFSALVDADYLDTERHFSPERPAVRERTREFELEALWKQFAFDQARFSQAAVSPVNRVRREIYERCVEVSSQSPGVFSLTVPTGGGKTRSGLAFAIKHAISHGLDRVIVAIPYTSIIEQTAEIYRGILGDAVLEHHSGLDPDRPDDGVHPDWTRLASENWDIPVIVTTTVQLFESLLANKPSRCRKLHNVANSVLILDEVQMLPPGLLSPIVDVLRELVAHYRVTVVLCTATQPALQETPELSGFRDVREIVDSPERHFAALRRVRYETPSGPLSWQDLAAAMRTEHQALAIVNTKRDAITLIDALEDTKALHLSTLLCGAHRRAVLSEVRRRLDADESCRLISTQVVEAGVDLDFPAVFRAVGPLDRIVQAAGRCNREGLLETGRMVIFEPKDGSALPRGAYRTGTEIARGLLRDAAFDFHQPSWYQRYFRLLYQARNLDQPEIQRLRTELDYPEVAARFRLIPDDTVPVVVPYHGPDGSDRAVDQLIAAIRSTDNTPQALFRRLQPYLVNLWRREVETQYRLGLLEELRPGLWRWLGVYDSVRGVASAHADPAELIV